MHLLNVVIWLMLSESVPKWSKWFPLYCDSFLKGFLKEVPEHQNLQTLKDGVNNLPKLQNFNVVCLCFKKKFISATFSNNFYYSKAFFIKICNYKLALFPSHGWRSESSLKLLILYCLSCQNFFLVRPIIPATR
jgi:hypothetical protein